MLTNLTRKPEQENREKTSNKLKKAPLSSQYIPILYILISHY